MYISKIMFLLLNIVCCALLFFCNKYAVANTEDYVPKTCADMQDEESRMICELARKFGAPFYQTGVVFFVAGIEVSGRVCNFKFTEKFNTARMKARNSKNMIQVYDFIVANSSENFPNKKAWCQKSYSMFGPNAPRGPNGGDNRMYR